MSRTIRTVPATAPEFAYSTEFTARLSRGHVAMPCSMNPNGEGFCEVWTQEGKRFAKARQARHNRRAAKREVAAIVADEFNADQWEQEEQERLAYEAWEAEIEAEHAARLEEEAAREEAINAEYRATQRTNPYDFTHVCVRNESDFCRLNQEWAKEIAARFDLEAYAEGDAEIYRDYTYGKEWYLEEHRDRDLARYFLAWQE